MSRLAPARRVAAAALVEAWRQGGYVRDILEASDAFRGLDQRDRGLALRLAVGVVATYGCLDQLIDRYVAKPRRLDVPVRMALRVSTFELLHLDRAPEVAVSQGVELARAAAPRAAGLANAVLRKVAAAREEFLDAADASAREREATARARRAGMPRWLADAVAASLGDAGARALAAAALEAAPGAFHVNPRRPDVLPQRDVALDEADEFMPGTLLGLASGAVIASGALADGAAVACDLNAQLVATAATAPGSCLEIGSGRGTKTFVMLAQARRLGWVHTHCALDLSAHKGELNRERLAAAGLEDGATCVTGDGRDLVSALDGVDGVGEDGLLFDTVLLDAPCSGTGTMRRHPEIPWRLDPRDVDTELPSLQCELLEEAAKHVRPGGQLLYATCSVMRSENADVAYAFLASPVGRMFDAVPVSEALVFDESGYERARAYVRDHEDDRGMFQTIPSSGSFDGHFCARFIRRA